MKCLREKLTDINTSKEIFSIIYKTKNSNTDGLSCKSVFLYNVNGII